MKIKIIRGYPRRTEHGIYYDQKHEDITLCHLFEPKVSKCGCGSVEPPDKVHVATIPLKRHIHPCYKDTNPCYKGDYYELRNGEDYTQKSGCCDECK
jgi:hypothetical protein